MNGHLNERRNQSRSRTENNWCKGPEAEEPGAVFGAERRGGRDLTTGVLPWSLGFNLQRPDSHFLNLFFLAILHSIWDLSSLTRD